MFLSPWKINFSRCLKIKFTSIIAGGLINLFLVVVENWEEQDESLLKAHSDYLSSETDFSFSLLSGARRTKHLETEIMRRGFVESLQDIYKMFFL